MSKKIGLVGIGYKLPGSLIISIYDNFYKEMFKAESSLDSNDYKVMSYEIFSPFTLT